MLRGIVSPRRRWIGWWIVFLAGALAALLVALGNPGNMGVCGVCFLRDLAGTLGMFSGPGPKIFRPELVGLMGGALGWVLCTRRFAARSGSHAATRFFFGIWMGLGALVFLGCPLRMLQRIGGGDLHAWVGALGLLGGVGLGVFFERRGYHLGKTAVVSPAVGLLGPSAIGILLVLFLVGGSLLGPGPGEGGPPAHAPWLAALGIALVVGVALSATGYCTISAARQFFGSDRTMLFAALFLIGGYALVAAVAGNFQFGFGAQPIAHGEWLWNILALALVGLTGCLTGGCPVRQIVMAGEGNGDAFVTVGGIVLGGALAHNLGIASSGAGTTPAGRIAVVVGLAVCVAFTVAFIVARTRHP